jgi:hypothetical protein
MTNRINEHIILDAVTSTGAGDPIVASQFKGWNFILYAASVTTGATIEIQVEVADGDWVTIHSETIEADGYTFVQSVDGFYRSIRANVTSYTDGTYYVFAQGSWVY